ncbi:Fic family protein [Spiroplasma citri]|uniref:Fic family protein n=1 Tax=Spiroplasma citri TaxID=2133 RepID=A0AAX3T097_SPICI|nr:Fic family protein [Spiroplasma citri]WFG97036.1 Fic family protein [Spiroplasma citri]WFH00933.1 Fic family protein [Spiroplasma citri]
MFYYKWGFINKNDVNLFKLAFIKTPNLNNENNNFWDISYNNIKLIHKTKIKDYKINVIWKKIILDDEFATYLIKIVYRSHEIAQKIKQEGLYGEKWKGSINETVNALVYKHSYNDKITANLLFLFECKQKFNNGNKRTALISCILFLKSCGLFFRYTNAVEKEYMNLWEPRMKEIVKIYESRKYLDEIIIEKIEKIIEENVTIPYTRY